MINQNSNTLEIFAKAMKKLRLDASLSQSDLSEICKMSIVTINQIEGARRSVSLSSLERIASSLGTTVANMVGLGVDLALGETGNDLKTGPRPRVLKRPLCYLYGSGYISAAELPYQIATDGGSLLVRIVRDEKSKGNFDLLYGIFYMKPSGECFDVLVQSNSRLKAFSLASRAIKYINSFAVSDENFINEGDLPQKNKDLSIKLGQLHMEFLEK